MNHNPYESSIFVPKDVADLKFLDVFRRRLLKTMYESVGHYQGDEDDLEILARFERGEKIKLDKRWRGVFLVAAQDCRLLPKQIDELKNILFEE